MLVKIQIGARKDAATGISGPLPFQLTKVWGRVTRENERFKKRNGRGTLRE
jgi:hypothetical protein